MSNDKVARVDIVDSRMSFWTNLHRLLFVAIWCAGLLLIWELTPAGGREGWQIPVDEFMVGFLSDGSTLVTVPRSATGDRILGTKESGPIRLWNIYTGQLLAEHFDKSYVFERVMVDAGEYLRIQEELEGKPGEFRLRLLDARTAREICTYRCRVPQKNVWWMISPDGKYSIFQSFEGENPHIELHDNVAKRLLKQIENWREPTRFSPDGSLFFASDDQQQDMGVFSAHSGELLMRIKPDRGTPILKYASPRSISPNNTLLVDHACCVWEVKTGKLRFHVPNIYYNSIAFTPDSRYLAVVAKGEGSCWIAWYDTVTGKEDEARRTPLASGKDLHMHLSPWYGNSNAQKKYLISHGTPGTLPAEPWKKWLAKIPGLGFLGQDKVVDGYVVVDVDTAQVVCRGPNVHASVSPDGETLVVSGRDNRYVHCDIPPRKPIRKFLLLTGSFSVLLLLPVGLRRVYMRYRRAGKQRPELLGG